MTDENRRAEFSSFVAVPAGSSATGSGKNRDGRLHLARTGHCSSVCRPRPVSLDRAAKLRRHPLSPLLPQPSTR